MTRLGAEEGRKGRRTGRAAEFLLRGGEEFPVPGARVRATVPTTRTEWEGTSAFEGLGHSVWEADGQ